MGAGHLLAELAGAGLSVTADRDRLVIRPASKLTDDMREALRLGKTEILALLAQMRHPNIADPAPASSEAFPPTDVDSALHLARHERVVDRGHSELEGDVLGEHSATRQPDDDDRVRCTGCQHYRPGRCGNHRSAGLHTSDVGRDFARLLQWCAGFEKDRVPSAPSRG